MIYVIFKRNIKIYEKWIYDLLHKYVSIANRDAGWNYTLTHSEGTQFTIYNKDQYYDWHVDQDLDPYQQGA